MYPRSRLLIPAVGLVFLFSSASPPASAPVSLDDVVALLRAGVGESIILKEIGDGGPSFALGVQEVLRLKAAGAGDHLIEALMAPHPGGAAMGGEPAGPEPSRQPGYRIYKERAADGQEVLHVTNLDEQGRRLGGESPDPVEVPNRYDTSERGEGSGSRADRRYNGEYAVIGDSAPSPPVVVNVYPPESTAPVGYAGGYGSPYMYRDPYAYSYPGGILPGYRPAYGYFRPPGTFAPPGSATHFQRSHWENGGMPCSRLGPNYAPIGSAIGFDTYYRHTHEGFGR